MDTYKHIYIYNKNHISLHGAGPGPGPGPWPLPGPWAAARGPGPAPCKDIWFFKTYCAYMILCIYNIIYTQIYLYKSQQMNISNFILNSLKSSHAHMRTFHASLLAIIPYKSNTRHMNPWKPQIKATKKASSKCHVTHACTCTCMCTHARTHAHACTHSLAFLSLM